MNLKSCRCSSALNDQATTVNRNRFKEFANFVSLKEKVHWLANGTLQTPVSQTFRGRCRMLSRRWLRSEKTIKWIVCLKLFGFNCFASTVWSRLFSFICLASTIWSNYLVSTGSPLETFQLDDIDCIYWMVWRHILVLIRRCPLGGRRLTRQMKPIHTIVAER